MGLGAMVGVDGSVGLRVAVGSVVEVAVGGSGVKVSVGAGVSLAGIKVGVFGGSVYIADGVEAEQAAKLSAANRNRKVFTIPGRVIAALPFLPQV